MLPKVLWVDDDSNILASYKRTFRRTYDIYAALGGAAGLRALANSGRFEVIVSDLRMPMMGGLEFLIEAQQIAPDSVRIMLTGNADQNAAVDAVNEGCIFRFLTKPCPPETLHKALQDGVEQYRLISAERELLSQTLTGTITVLTDILRLVNPTAVNRTSRIRKLVSLLVQNLGIKDTWQLEVAVELSQVGCVTIPEKTLSRVCRGLPLDPDEQRVVDNAPLVASTLLAHIPRMEEVCRIIAYHQKHYDGSGIPADKQAGENLPLGSRVLKLAGDYDMLESTGIERSEVLSELRHRKGWYDPGLLDMLEKVLNMSPIPQERCLGLKELEPDMVLAQDIRSNSGSLLCAKGQVVSKFTCSRLLALAETGEGVRVPIHVLIEKPE